jgi:biopolymer transport protein ExbD
MYIASPQMASKKHDGELAPLLHMMFVLMLFVICVSWRCSPW